MVFFDIQSSRKINASDGKWRYILYSHLWEWSWFWSCMRSSSMPSASCTSSQQLLFILTSSMTVGWLLGWIPLLHGKESISVVKLLFCSSRYGNLASSFSGALCIHPYTTRGPCHQELSDKRWLLQIRTGTLGFGTGISSGYLSSWRAWILLFCADLSSSADRGPCSLGYHLHRLWIYLYAHAMTVSSLCKEL